MEKITIPYSYHQTQPQFNKMQPMGELTPVFAI